MTRYYDLTKMTPEQLMKDLTQHCLKANTVSKLNIQCIRAAAKQDFLSEEEMDDVNFFPNIHRG